MVQAAVRADEDGRYTARPAEADARGSRSPHDLIPGGSNSAFPLPLSGCIDRAAGTRVWDEGGREYVDFLLASGPLILGHAHPRVCEAVIQQVSRGSAYHALNRPALELAERIVDVPGCVEMVRFASTGTEATMHALRLARACTGREKALVFTGSYHGSHDVSIIGHRGALKARTGGVPTSAIEDTVVARFNDIGSVESAFAAHGESLAAVLVEPQQRTLDPEQDFLPRLAEICSRYGTMLIFDEVLTGFRLAYGGAQEYYGVRPDLVCYGKIVGGGYPLSAVGGPREIMRMADPNLAAGSSNFVHMSGTLSGNPVSAAAGVATLDELRGDGVYERLHYLGERLRDGLRREMDRCGADGTVFGSGPMAAVNFADAEGRPACDVKLAVNREMVRGGVLLQLQTRFYLSLVHTEEEIDFAVRVFGESLEGVLGSQAAEEQARAG